MKNTFKTKRLVTLAMFAAISVVLVAIIHFPIFPAAPFLVYDPADIPIFISTFMFGPWVGALLTAVVAVIQGTTVNAADGPIGIVMHMLATGAFAIVAGLIYRKMHNRKGAVIALITGTVTMTLVMVLWNIILTPIFLGAPRQAVYQLLIPAIIPFNLIKAGANSVIAYLVYKPISKMFSEKDKA